MEIVHQLSETIVFSIFSIYEDYMRSVLKAASELTHHTIDMIQR